MQKNCSFIYPPYVALLTRFDSVKIVFLSFWNGKRRGEGGHIIISYAPPPSLCGLERAQTKSIFFLSFHCFLPLLFVYNIGENIIQH